MAWLGYMYMHMTCACTCACRYAGVLWNYPLVRYEYVGVPCYYPVLTLGFSSEAKAVG